MGLHYKMPEEYKGGYRKRSNKTGYDPRIWTKKEIEWVYMLKEKGLSNTEIAECIDRDITQVSIKIKRVAKKDKGYNRRHVDEKYSTNELFFDMIKPKSVLDVYSGPESWYFKKGIKLTSNDKDKNYAANFNMDALEFLCKMFCERKKFDLIDLDPFGSAYDCFDLSIKMAKKALIITLGEMGHKRFKRFDFVRRYYGIEKLESFTSDKLVEEIIKIGVRNKKKLVPIFVKDWRNISRVYFKIDSLNVGLDEKIKK